MPAPYVDPLHAGNNVDAAGVSHITVNWADATTDEERLEKIKGISQWAWHIEQRKNEDLYELYCDKFPDDKVDYSDFKILINRLKKDKDYKDYCE